MDKQNYNFMALQGFDISDEDYVDEFGVPPEYAYTPQLNYWMIDHVFERDVKAFQDSGMTHREAQKMANSQRDSKRAEVKELMAKKGLLS